jgi:predicted lipoprotein
VAGLDEEAAQATLGRAWLEPDGGGNLVQPRGRIRPGFLDERRAHVAMAKLIAEHEEELERRPTRPQATFDDAVEAWLDYSKTRSARSRRRCAVTGRWSAARWHHGPGGSRGRRD